MKSNRTVTFRNVIQVALFEREIKGQLSDGYWENANPMDHHRTWCDAVAVVGPNVGRNFWTVKSNYNLIAAPLLDAVGGRMLTICEDVLGRPGFTMRQLRAELKDMKTIMTTFASEI